MHLKAARLGPNTDNSSNKTYSTHLTKYEVSTVHQARGALPLESANLRATCHNTKTNSKGRFRRFHLHTPIPLLHYCTTDCFVLNLLLRAHNKTTSHPTASHTCTYTHIPQDHGSENGRGITAAKKRRIRIFEREKKKGRRTNAKKSFGTSLDVKV